MATEHSENVATQQRNASHMAEGLNADNWRSTGLRRNVWKYGFNSWCVKRNNNKTTRTQLLRIWRLSSRFTTHTVRKKQTCTVRFHKNVFPFMFLYTSLMMVLQDVACLQHANTTRHYGHRDHHRQYCYEDSLSQLIECKRVPNFAPRSRVVLWEMTEHLLQFLLPPLGACALRTSH